MKPTRRERRIVERNPSRSLNSAIEPMKPPGAGGDHRRLLRRRQRLGVRRDTGRGGEILGAEVERAEPQWARAISARRKKAAAVSTIAINRVVPRRHAAFGFDLVDDLGDQPHMFRTVGLWQTQRQHPRADHGLDVAHRQAQGPVDADHDIGPAPRDDLGRLRHQDPRSVFLGGGHTIFEIEDDRVGAAPCRAIDKATLCYRHKQQ